MKPLRWSLDHPELIVGCIGGSARVEASDAALAEALMAMQGTAELSSGDDATRAAVRDLLRGHGYKPTGRGKPASEFLAAAAARGELQCINNLVDINNLLSLQSGLPISVFDRRRAGDGQLELRLGHAGEAFIFNAAGQSIDVGGLICVARLGGEAIGNPVKDSMATKLVADSDRFLAVIYGSTRLLDAAGMRRWCERFADLAERHAAAGGIQIDVLTQEGAVA